MARKTSHATLMTLLAATICLGSAATLRALDGGHPLVATFLFQGTFSLAVVLFLAGRECALEIRQDAHKQEHP